MNIEHLVTMANQIGAFFGSYPDREQAKKDVVAHLKRFWALPMRKQIVTYVNERQGQGLDPMVNEAISQNTQLLV